MKKGQALSSEIRDLCMHQNALQRNPNIHPQAAHNPAMKQQSAEWE
jgi:hypothetical protein